MSPVSNCPNCGARIQFRWSSAVQTVCEFCRSILVRRDVNLERVGTVADLPPDSSPIQLGVEGIYRGRAFQAVGRIIYEYEQGGWNEWHIAFNDGTSGWLSDAQADYAVTFLAAAKEPLPQAGSLERGRVYRVDGTPFELMCLTRARYRGVEGDLPFEYWDKQEMLFADLASPDGRLATLDYSEPVPLLFIGQPVEFDDLLLKNLREFEGWYR